MVCRPRGKRDVVHEVISCPQGRLDIVDAPIARLTSQIYRFHAQHGNPLRNLYGLLCDHLFARWKLDLTLACVSSGVYVSSTESHTEAYTPTVDTVNMQ